MSVIQFLPRQDFRHADGPLPEELIPASDDYVGYFANQFSEEIIFIQRPSEPFATVVHSDVGWEPYKVADDLDLLDNLPSEHKKLISKRKFAGPFADGLILDAAEAAWVRACWLASEWRRQPPGSAEVGA